MTMPSHILDKINTLLVTNPTNLRYLTGFSGAADNEREVYLLITTSQAFLFTNNLYLEQARNLKLSNCYIAKLLKYKKPLEIVEISGKNPFEKNLFQILRRFLPATLQGETFKGLRLGFEEENLTVSEYNKFKQKLKGVTFVPTHKRIEKLRMIKRPEEIKNIRAAAKLTDECFSAVLNKLKPGVTETEISWEIESFFKLKLKGPTLKENDLILLDFGARLRGYCSDMTRVVFLGKPKTEWQRAYEAVLSAQSAAIDKLKSCFHVSIHESKPPEISGAALDKIARNVMKTSDFKPYPHSLGHAVGLDIHELPRLTVKQDAKLLPGMVVTIEPGIYKEGRYGIRIEDLVLLKKGSIEILSKSPKEMTIL